MNKKVIKEITPLTQADCFTVFKRSKTEFDFPLHFHEDMELTFILNARGAKRVIGDHLEEIDDIELVLIGPNLEHGWFNSSFNGGHLTEVTIQFHSDFFDDKFLKKNQLSCIRNLFDKSARGVLFSTETAHNLQDRIMNLGSKQGFDSVLELMSILHNLSTSDNYRVLSDSTFHMEEKRSYNSRRIERVMNYTRLNFHRPVSLGEVAQLINMTDTGFSRFFKLRTGITYVDCLTEIRLGHASRMLIDTTHPIAEIAYDCGFNNISNFNRIFRKKKGCTPRELRKSYEEGIRVFI